jgi:tRNA-2-methylthio-N6-dimethylallyladenosine synthase
MLREEELKIIDASRQGEVLQVPATSLTGKKLYLESYGCAMNFADSEIIASIMQGSGFQTTQRAEDADLIFLNTCAIRDNAELKIWARLKSFRQAKRKNPGLLIGVLGCMAERLKTKLLEQEKLVDLVVGPDSYRDLPNLVKQAEEGHKAVNVLLSREETYAEISPVRLGSNGISAFISIMRGCDNMCSFCVVPFTRGRERSRDPQSVIAEAKSLFGEGYKEITLLGQNVDSYLWSGGGLKKDLEEADVRRALENNLPEEEQQRFVTFADLLDRVAGIDKSLRIRFSTSNPRDMTDAVLHVMAKHENICKSIHLPVQSGNSRILEKMNRGYTREQYKARIEAIRRILPDAGISTDIITGFCSETDEEHNDTLSIMEWAGYDYAYMFKYSERPGTAAAKKFVDDVPEEVKAKRLDDIIRMQSRLSHEGNKKDVGKVFLVLTDSVSKRSENHLSGRTSQNKVVIFPRGNHKPGDYVKVRITDCTPATLLGEAVEDLVNTGSANSLT